MENKYFIAVYTNEVKDYCEEEFFERVFEISKGVIPVCVIDNSLDSRYTNRLNEINKNRSNFHIAHLDISEEPKRTQFLRNVSESVLHLRSIFLSGDYTYFIILESDVIPPKDLLDRFDKDIPLLDIISPTWGALGGIYYKGFHDYDLGGLHQIHHVLSGCTLYKRDLIKKYPFRWSKENLGAFPDAWICKDAEKEYTFYNDHEIVCDHLFNPKTKTRYTKAL